MLKKIGVPLLALAAMFAVTAPKQASAAVRIGVAIGGPVYRPVAPAYVAPAYVAPCPPPADVAPAYVAPAPVVVYPRGRFVRPYHREFRRW